ncbi:NAD-reducing hydrogenase HoxS subunit beta [Aquisphaera giovannonii]|uniref:NAD-reducing hydrogenase HoxS subunit beta n=1 Tax=Aquisphaera giovannonii TaxID=406548 RepID=A0A5B9W8G8_9BACT|nr:Ni/Fe hydrogenase subunit alpha [Aquisphaera giovannonii]QEH36986.1 NAD-reducing hydrogenase HoxS subunit beta [Aquisphaera giovannonii]
MAKQILVDPVTRIEGHAKITIQLDDSGEVRDARFHVAEFRGFEKFCEGRPLWEMPGITARVCGICPISHLLASSKAGDAILAVSIPPAATKLRRLMNLGQIVQSHALSFFHMSAPDLLLGMEGDPASRNLFGLIAAEPEFARRGIRLRQFGQEVIETLGGRKIHPAWSVPGGVRGGLAAEGRDRILGRLPEAFDTAQVALRRFKEIFDRFHEEAACFGDFPTLFMGMVSPEGHWEHYDGTLRIAGSDGEILADHLDPSRYAEFLREAVEPDSYLKSPYYQPLGYPGGIYRVGPLARLNVCNRMGVPRAEQELKEFRYRFHGTGTSSFLYHYARLIEILAALELIETLLDDPDLGSDQLRASAGINRLDGVGASEAPRGTLFHDYSVDRHGLITRVNLIIATGQNNLAMNRTVAQIARHYIRDGKASEGILNRIEAGIRAYDPCLSCSTHAAGRMPLVVRILDGDGTLRQEIRRE